MAPLLPLGFAILGLGCTLPLTIGGSEFDTTTSENDGGATDDAGSGTVVDAGSPVDAGSATDAGSCIQNGPARGASYASCCTSDVQDGLCHDPKGWVCTDFRVCTTPAGSCYSTGHTCTTFGDCCTQVCTKGFCAGANWPDAGATGPGSTQSCAALTESCSSYSDCCSQNCAFGQCVTATIPTSCGGFEAACELSTDCCSQECDNGLCRDTTLPWYLQTAGAQIRDNAGLESIHNNTELAPRFELNRVDDFAGQNPAR